MSYENMLYTILTSALTSGLLFWGIKYRLQYSIKHEYDLNLEKFKNEIETKKRAELIAKLLSLWLTHPEKQQELNRLTFEAFLWLPDEIAHDLSNLLAHSRNAPEMRSILLSVRKYLLDGKTDLDESDIIIFTQEYKNITNSKGVHSA